MSEGAAESASYSPVEFSDAHSEPSSPSNSQMVSTVAGVEQTMGKSAEEDAVMTELVEEDKAMAIYANQYETSSEMGDPAPTLDPNDEDIPFMDEEEDNDTQSMADNETDSKKVMDKLDETLNWIARISREAERALSPQSSETPIIVDGAAEEIPDTQEPAAEDEDEVVDDAASVITAIDVESSAEESTLDVSTVDESTTIDDTIKGIATIESGSHTKL